jgi:hypothetical protein
MSTSNPVPPAASQADDPPPGMTRRQYRQISATIHPTHENLEAIPGEDIISAEPAPPPARVRRKLNFWPAFWTISGILSLTINVVLIVILLALAGQIFNLKAVIQTQLIGGLRQNFALMDQASIKTTIPVKADVPAKFNLPLKTETTVTLTKDTTIRRARVTALTTGGLTITNAPADIMLPAGTLLPIALDLVVPVDQKIPVNLAVNVDIPLNQTDLHKPFTGLQKVIDPYYTMLNDLPGSWQELVCGKNPSDFCKVLFPK